MDVSILLVTTLDSTGKFHMFLCVVEEKNSTFNIAFVKVQHQFVCCMNTTTINYMMVPYIIEFALLTEGLATLETPCSKKRTE